MSLSVNSLRSCVEQWSCVDAPSVREPRVCQENLGRFGLGGPGSIHVYECSRRRVVGFSPDQTPVKWEINAIPSENLKENHCVVIEGVKVSKWTKGFEKKVKQEAAVRTAWIKTRNLQIARQQIRDKVQPNRDQKVDEEKAAGVVLGGQRAVGNFPISISGGKYTGQMLRNQRHGEGCMMYADGSKYEGQWVEDKRHGLGKMIKMVKGQCTGQYEGQWKRDQKEGIGLETYLDGSYYDGLWKNDLYHGQGMMMHADGTQEKGTWFNGKRHGAMMYVQKGKRTNEQWEDGEKIEISAVRKDSALFADWDYEAPSSR